MVKACVCKTHTPAVNITGSNPVSTTNLFQSSVRVARSPVKRLSAGASPASGANLSEYNLVLSIGLITTLDFSIRNQFLNN